MTTATTTNEAVDGAAPRSDHRLSTLLLDALFAAVGHDHVLTDPGVTATYETDWTRRFSGRSACVVRPASTAEVAAVLRACHEADAPVVIQGGNTGLVGGGVPAGGEVLLSMLRVNTVGEVDTAARQVLVGGGATLSSVQAQVRPLGLDVGVDYAARDSATIGGMVATNAGGENVLRHGPMKAQVVGMEAVTADGSILTRLSGLPKDNTGYDLVGLLGGSEGTLAVITSVLLRLVPRATQRCVAVLGCDSVAAAQAALGALRVRLADLESAELFLADGLALVRDHTKLPPLMSEEHAAYLLIEVAHPAHDPSEALFAALEDLTESIDGLADVVIGEDGPTRERLWHYREAHTESVSAAGIPVKLDVSLPAGVLNEGITALPAAAHKVAPGAKVYVWGHVNEGNLHVNVLPAAGGAFDHDTAEAVTDAVLRAVAERGGSISAEHGVGRAKTPWLSLTRSPAEIATMRAIKAAFDPGWLLNPGVVLPSA